MKTLLLILGALIAPSVSATEMTNVVCVKPADESFIKLLEGNRRFVQEQCEKYGNKGVTYCDHAAGWEKIRDDCSIASFASKKIFTINKSLLNQAEPQPIEQTTWDCVSGAEGEVQKGFLVASPSYLQLGDTKYELSFHIDRKTLNAGKNEKRDYKCTIEEIDTSSNAI